MSRPKAGPGVLHGTLASGNRIRRERDEIYSLIFPSSHTETGANEIKTGNNAVVEQKLLRVVPRAGV